MSTCAQMPSCQLYHWWRPLKVGILQMHAALFAKQGLQVYSGMGAQRERHVSVGVQKNISWCNIIHPPVTYPGFHFGGGLGPKKVIKEHERMKVHTKKIQARARNSLQRKTALLSNSTARTSTVWIACTVDEQISPSYRRSTNLQLRLYLFCWQNIWTLGTYTNHHAPWTSGQYPYAMFGFCTGLLAQHALLQPKKAKKKFWRLRYITSLFQC